jgi:hypothetical protein
VRSQRNVLKLIKYQRVTFLDCLVQNVRMSVASNLYVKRNVIFLNGRVASFIITIGVRDVDDDHKFLVLV